MANSSLDRLNGPFGIGAGAFGLIGLGGIGLDLASGKLNGFQSSDKITSNLGLLGQSNASDVGKGSVLDGLNNSLTGNLDFQRELELLKRNQSFNALEAQKQRDWEEYMSSSSYQRQAEDLKKAGYNPALVLGSGGASSPSGSSASSSASHHSSGSSSVVNGLVNAIMQMSLTSARSNEALSASRLLDEKAELIREMRNQPVSSNNRAKNAVKLFDYVYSNKLKR